MTTKKTETEVIETVEAAEPVETDPWKIMVDVKLPRAGANEEKSVFFSLNHYTCQIPRGKVVPVPKPIAERVKLYLEALEREEDVRDEIPSNF